MRNQCKIFMKAAVLVSCASTPQGEPVSAPEVTGPRQSERDRIAQYRKQRRVGDLRVRDEAPDFTLTAADGSREVRLSSFEGKREVVLIFGSYT